MAALLDVRWVLPLLALGFLPAREPAPSLPSTPAELTDRLDAAFAARDVDAYLALWEFADPEAREAERQLVGVRFAAEEVRLTLRRRPVPADAEKSRLSAQLFTASE